MNIIHRNSAVVGLLSELVEQANLAPLTHG